MKEKRVHADNHRSRESIHSKKTSGMEKFHSGAERERDILGWCMMLEPKNRKSPCLHLIRIPIISRHEGWMANHWTGVRGVSESWPSRRGGVILL